MKPWDFFIEYRQKIEGSRHPVISKVVGGGGTCQLLMGGAASIKWSHTSWGGQWCRGWENRRGKG